MLKNLINVIRGMSSLSIVPEVVEVEEDIKVFSNVEVTEDAGNIIIKGINEYCEEDHFIIAVNSIVDIQTDGYEDYFMDIDVFLKNGDRLSIESF